MLFPGYNIAIGQNWAGGYTDWEKAIMAWHGEVKDFTYGAKNRLEKVGHYTQVCKCLYNLLNKTKRNNTHIKHLIYNHQS